jgi:hypothetical protein
MIALLSMFIVPATAHADLFSVYVSGNSSMIKGQGSAFEYFDRSIGSGAEAGIELLGVDIWGEALNMGNDQLYFTANLGFDLTYGKKWRFSTGLYTGPVLFMRPQVESGAFELSGSVRSALSAAGIDPTMVENEYNEVKGQEDELSQYALGWNLARVRLQFERELVPLVYVGIGGQGSYHMMLTGDQAASAAKHDIANDLDSRYQLNQMNPQLSTELRSELGAKKLDTDALGGFNFSLNAYVKVEI